jgi:hypothetical protein
MLYPPELRARVDGNFQCTGLFAAVLISAIRLWLHRRIDCNRTARGNFEPPHRVVPPHSACVKLVS